MPVFVYEAKNLQGITVKGKIDAVDMNALTTSLREKNYFPVKIKPYSNAMNIDFNDYKKLTLKDISIFCRQFAVIISAGISIVKALEIVKEQTENIKFKKILNFIYDDVQKGKSLSEAMGEHKDIPNMLVNMITVGETSGTLDKILDTMAAYYDKEYKQQQKIKQALTYPAVISIFAIVVVTMLVTKVVPIFTNMISSLGGQVPMPTRIVMGISDFIKTKGLFVLALIIFSAILLKYLSNNKANKLKSDKYLMKIPIFGPIYKKIITARFARTFGILMGSGVPLIECIDICADVLESKTVYDIMMSLKEEVKKGAGLGETLESRKIFPIMLTQMMKIGEESGSLDNILKKTAEFYDTEVETATAQLTSLIEPAIIILLSVIVGFIILSIILPVFSMYNSFS